MIRHFAPCPRRLAAFDPARGSNMLKLSYSSVWGNSSLTLKGNGTLISETKQGTRTLGVIAPDRCKAVFHKVLTNGCEQSLIPVSGRWPE